MGEPVADVVGLGLGVFDGVWRGELDGEGNGDEDGVRGEGVGRVVPMKPVASSATITIETKMARAAPNIARVIGRAMEYGASTLPVQRLTSPDRPRFRVLRSCAVPL